MIFSILFLTIHHLISVNGLTPHNSYTAVKSPTNNYQNHLVQRIYHECSIVNTIVNSSKNRINIFLNAQTTTKNNDNEINDSYIDSTYSMYEKEQTPSNRKVKKNRYSNYSKISNDQDPLDLLLAESKQKNIELKQKKKNKNSNAEMQSDVKRTRNEMTFPPLPTIDPYDPTTYGFIELGTIIGAHGIKGQVKLKSTTEFGTVRLCKPNTLRHIKMPNRRSPREIILKSGKEIDAQNNIYLLKLHTINNRIEAKKLRGAMLYAREEQQDEIIQSVVMEENEYFMNDLIELDVYLLDDIEKDMKYPIGVINGMVFAEDLCDVPGLGNDYLEIALNSSQNNHDGNNSNREKELVLLPFVPQIVPVVNIEEKHVFIDPPVGLLDLTYVRQRKVSIKGLLPPAKI